jgi:hypothetical protein
MLKSTLSFLTLPSGLLHLFYPALQLCATSLLNPSPASFPTHNEIESMDGLATMLVHICFLYFQLLIYVENATRIAINFELITFDHLNDIL